MVTAGGAGASDANGRPMTWLVTGGSGYLGVHVVRGLVAQGAAVVVLDNLTRGCRADLPERVALVPGDVLDRALVRRTLVGHRVTGVIHLAARKSVAESMDRPWLYYRDNVGGLAGLLDAMCDAGTANLVFASSAAVYGATGRSLIDEGCRTRPTNHYGVSKLVGENLVASAAQAGLSAVSLRFFNIVGSTVRFASGVHVNGLVGGALTAAVTGVPLTVHGADYPTADGSGVRDYQHVDDAARSVVMTADRLASGRPPGAVLNVASGGGVSVFDVIDHIGTGLGLRVPYRLGGRRPGDTASAVGDISRIRSRLTWQPRFALPDIVASLWRTAFA